LRFLTSSPDQTRPCLSTRLPDAGSRVAEAEARGLILLSCGTRLNVIRLLPPLTIEWDVLSEGLDILEAAIEAAFSLPSDTAAV